MDPGEKEDVRRSHQCTVSALQRMRAGHYRAAVGNKETLAAIAARYKINCSNIHNKIKLLEEDYASFRRIRQDGNNFYRSFMFSYLERVMEKQDLYEFDRVLKRILRCRRMNAILGGHEYTFDELAQELQHVLERIIRGAPNSMSPDEFLLNCLDEHASLNVMIFFRLVTSIEIHMNSNFYRPKIHAKYRSMEEFVLEQDMIVGFETDQLRVKALSEALGIPTKVVQFDVLAPVPEIPKLPYCFCDGSSRRNFSLGLLSDDFVLISGSSDEHAVPPAGPPSPVSSVSDAEDVGGSTSDYDSVIIFDLRGCPSYVTLVFWRGHYGVLYRNSVLSRLKLDFF